MPNNSIVKDNCRIPFSKPTIGREEIDAVTEVMRSGWLCAGEQTRLFEEEFAKYVGVKYAIFTNSCTSALKLAYKYFKEVERVRTYKLLTPNTFCATYSAAEEIGLESGNKGVRVATHYGGVQFLGQCDLEDSAHRIEPNDPLVGLIRCYSFYATKNMTTGSGGMLVTNDEFIYNKIRLYWKDGLTTSTYDRMSGKGFDYKVEAMSGGYDGNDIAAAIGRVQLAKLPVFTAFRNSIVRRYNNAFNKDWTGNHLYPYFVDTLEDVPKFINYMKDKGIHCGYHYPGQGWLGVSLPLYPSMTDEEVNYVINEVKKWEQINPRLQSLD